MLGIVADGDFERLDRGPYGDRVGRDDDLFNEPLRAALSQNEVIGPDIWPERMCGSRVDRRAILAERALSFAGIIFHTFISLIMM
jgi:hypothetical protein